MTGGVVNASGEEVVGPEDLNCRQALVTDRAAESGDTLFAEVLKTSIADRHW